MRDQPATLHPVAARGFAAGAAAYERSRPEYPPEAIADIVTTLDLHPGRTVLELGAGTGKMTRLLVPTGARVLALEPVPEMRSRLADAVTTAGATTGAGAQVELIDATAEAIPLEAGSVDAVVIAQAFHWFDAIRALSEIHRVLRPEGRLVLAWNRRDESVPWVRALGDRIRTLAHGEPQVWDAVWRAALARCALFGPFESHRFRQVQRLTMEGLHDRISSVSFVAAAPDDVQAAVLADIDSLLDADPTTGGRSPIELPYDTEIMSAVSRSPSPGDVGTVASVNLNAGGVPKQPVDETRIGRLGLEGDAHREPEPIHGGPDQAVCVYAQEAIERVRADGHQAFPGAFGENLTLLGIDWAALHVRDRLELGAGGEGPLLELTKTATPCQTQAHWFVDGRIARISVKVHPEDTRWYARVLRDGRVAPGIPVRRLAAGTG